MPIGKLKNPIMKICANSKCQKQFLALNINQKYCTRECFDVRTNKETTIPFEVFCKNCKKSFFTNNPRKIFCSFECYKIKQKKIRNIGICNWCKSPFPEKSQFQKYCCTECGEHYRVMTRKIYSAFPFEYEKIDAEIAKLKVQGKNYQLGSA